MYNYIESYIQNISEDRNFALGYFNKNGKISFIANGESDFFSSDILIINTKKEFDKSYLGNEIKLLVLESDSSDIETLIQDTIYEWWHPSDLFDTITITIPDTIVNDNEIFDPKKVTFIGEYVDSSIVLNIEFQVHTL